MNANDVIFHRTRRRVLRFFVALMCLSYLPFCVAVIADENTQLTESLELAHAVDIAVRDNPNLAEMQARYEALTNIPSQVGALPDPIVSFGAMNFPTDTFARGQEPMTQLQFGVNQKFPFPGKLGLREQAAEYDAIAAAYSVDEVRLQLVSGVKSRWWELFYLDRAIETVGANQGLLKQFITVAKTKYETGTGLQQDVLLAQLELSKLIDRNIQLNALRRDREIKLNVLMDQPTTNSLILPSKTSMLMPDLLGEQELSQKAGAVRPLLDKMETQVNAAQSRLELAKRDYYPDFMLGATYGERTGNNPPIVGGTRSDFLSLMLSVNVPIFLDRKQSKAVSQRSSELRSHEYALIDERSLVMGQVSSAVTDYERARKQHGLFKTGILPQARQTVQSMLAGYQVDEVDFLNLVGSQITLFNYELEYWKALVEANQALARLEAAVGEEDIYE